MIRLENWSVGAMPPKNAYEAPELHRWHLHGRTFGHPRYEDGVFVATSAIEKIDGSTITTESGSVYILGEPAKEYVQWCVDKGCHVPTREEPIKVS
jgi:hypothetical protein